MCLLSPEGTPALLGSLSELQLCLLVSGDSHISFSQWCQA